VNWPGAVLFITHDRAFLQRLATRIIEIDRGKLVSWPGDYRDYLRRKAEAIEEEATAQRRVRPQAGGGGGLDPARHQGAAHAKRGTRQGAAGTARDPCPAREPPRQPRASPSARLTIPGRKVMEVKKVSFGYDDEPLISELT
jgi:ABC transport system ATP-binding/permease protein